jgi:hypothetical protein
MAEEDITEDILTYEKDIVPLRKQYFEKLSGSKYIKPEGQAVMSEMFGKELMGSFADRAKIQEMGEVNKSRRLNFEAAKFELEKAREDAANKRNMLESFKPFQQTIDSILQDPNLDSAERKRQIGIMGVRNAGLLATNDAAAKAYGAAQLGVGEEDKKKLTVFDYVRSGGDTKYLSEINPDVTKVDINQEVNPAWMLDRLNKSGLSKERQKTALEQESKRQTEVKNTIDSLVSGLNTVKLAKPKFGQEGEIADVFEDEGSAFKVSSVVEALGSEEDIAKFKATPSAKAQWDIARQIGHNYMKVKVGGGTNTPTQPNASSLYTSSKPKPEPNISPFVTQ